MSLIETLAGYDFDKDTITSEVMHLLRTHDTANGQLCLTHSKLAESVCTYHRLLEGTGSLYDFDKNEPRYREDDFVVFNRDFRKTHLYEMYSALPDIGRFRIMVMDGPQCYTIHRDYTKRYHYVLETNDNCFFLFPDDNEMIHVPADGNIHLLDTTKSHTFVNGSKQRRIHLVLDALGTYTQ